PGLAAGEEFINYPYPDSAGLQSYPEVLNAPLPVFTAWATTPTIEIDGVSTDLGASSYPEYVHDAGWSAGFRSGTREPKDLAQSIADRQTNHVGQVMIECEAAPVRIGERWKIRLTTTADIELDVVVIGIPRLEASAGRASMTLRCWALGVTEAT